MSLYTKTVKGVKWNFISTFGNMPLQFIITVILARLLSPEDFGLLGMSLVAITISKTMVESGLNQALIQKKDPDPEDFSVVFAYNLLLSLLFFIVIFYFSNAIERFYGQNENISNIIKVLSIIVIVEAFSLIQRVKLAKAIRFDLIAKINIFSTLLSGSIGICLAFLDFGIWSLVYKHLIHSLTKTAFFWILNPIKIDLSFSWLRFKSLFNFGSKVFFVDQIESLSNQLARILIGKYYTPASLGFYTKAEQLQNILSQTSLISVNKVIFPSFSQIQNDDLKLKKSYKVLMKAAMLIIFPLMFTAIIVADNLIPFLLGDKWLEVVPYFKILCVGGMAYPFTIFNLNIIKVKGKANLYVKISLISKGLLVPAILIGLQFHIIGLVVALAIQRFCAGIINSYYSGSLINYGLLEQVKDILPFFIMSGTVFFIAIFLNDFVNLQVSSDILLVLLCSIFMFTGYLALLGLFKRNELISIKKIIVDSIK